MMWFATLLLAWTTQAGGVDPYYETRSLSLRLGPDMSMSTMQREIDARWKRLGRGDVVDASGEELTVKRLSQASTLAALVPLLHDARGAEVDVIVHDEAQRLVPVTVRWEPDRLVVDEGPPLPDMFPPGPGPDQMMQRHGIVVVGGWDPAALGLLDRALSVLSAAERDRVKGLRFHRETGPPAYLRAKLPKELDVVEAAYLRDDQGPRVEVYDAAVEVSSRFVGEPAAPEPFSFYVLLHELGHAVADAPNRVRIGKRDEAFEAHNRLADEVNALIRERNAVAEKGGKVSDLDSRIDAMVQEAERLRDLVQAPVPDTDFTPAARELSEVLPRRRGPTWYSRTGDEELFAESFALFHADPAALKRVTPEVHAWFAEGRHLAARRTDQEG